MNPSEDLNQLLNHAVTAAGEMIVLQGGVPTFGAGGRSESGELVGLTVRLDGDEDEDEPEPGDVRDAVYEALRTEVGAGMYRAVCAVSDGMMAGDDGRDIDAVIIRMEHAEHEPLLLVLPYFKERGEWTFGELSRAPYDELQFFRPPA